MIIKSAQFVKSSAKLTQCPAPNLPEYAFIGRSNVGKSSLINMLAGIKALAKVSSTPGKTQLINHYEINGTWYLVDLPGYGYAKVGKGQRQILSDMINSYITKRENLQCVFVLIDSRHKPQEIDVTFINWLGTNGVPFSIVFTKADKLGTVALETSLNNYKQHLLEFWDELPQTFTTSAANRTGRDEILNFINSINQQFNNEQ